MFINKFSYISSKIIRFNRLIFYQNMRDLKKLQIRTEVNWKILRNIVERTVSKYLYVPKCKKSLNDGHLRHL